MSARPFTLLIAALGGEGGGVLTDWIVSAAEACDLPVQSTSIPGVAQRTGATTYYIEIYPVPHKELGGRRPVLALSPGVGDVDLVVASELLEAGRAISSGFVTTDRTLLLASTSRVYLTVEKMQMADGRYDSERLIKAAGQNAKEHLLFDMEAAAKQAGAIVNSVMLGAIAGSGRLPIPVEAFEAAIKHDGKAVESNLRGFRAGLAAARDQLPVPLARSPKRPAKPTLADLEAEAAALPEAARAFATEGVRRLAAYQNLDYARLYLQRLKPIAEADARANAGGKLLSETARHLAVRMSFEDVIRVAEAKIAPERFRRIEGEIGAEGSALRHHGIPEARHRGAVPGAAAAACARDRGVFGEARLARESLFRHGAEDHDRVGLSRASGRWRSSSASARRAGASPRSRPSSKAGSRASSRPRSCRATSRSKSPNARA